MSVYEIRVKGRMDKLWATWFDGLQLTYEGDNTVLRGTVADEAALHGVLTKLGYLNLHLLYVITVETGGVTPAARAASDTAPAIGRAPTRQVTASGEPAAETSASAPARKRKAGTSRKHRPRHSTS